MLPSFSTLKKNYPLDDRAALYKKLGGQWPAKVDDPALSASITSRVIPVKSAGSDRISRSDLAPGKLLRPAVIA